MPAHPGEAGDERPDAPDVAQRAHCVATQRAAMRRSTPRCGAAQRPARYNGCVMRRRKLVPSGSRGSMVLVVLRVPTGGTGDGSGYRYARALCEVGYSRVVCEMGYSRVLCEMGSASVLCEMGYSRVLCEVGYSRVLCEMGSARVLRGDPGTYSGVLHLSTCRSTQSAGHAALLLQLQEDAEVVGLGDRRPVCVTACALVCARA
jgi:hypothetical protein